MLRGASKLTTKAGFSNLRKTLTRNMSQQAGPENTSKATKGRFGMFSKSTYAVLLAIPSAFLLYKPVAKFFRGEQNDLRQEKELVQLKIESLGENQEHTHLNSILSHQHSLGDNSEGIEVPAKVPSSKKKETPNTIEQFTDKTKQNIQKHFKDLSITEFNSKDYETIDKTQTKFLAIPVFLNEAAIKSIAGFISSFEMAKNEKQKIVYKIISSKDDFKELESCTGVNFIDENENFSVIAIYNQNLNKFLAVKLSELDNPRSDFMYKFQPIEKINSKTKAEEILLNLKTDELILGLCLHQNDVSSRGKFASFVLQNDNIDIKNIIPVEIAANKDLIPCVHNELLAFLKSKGKQPNFSFENSNFFVSKVDNFPEKSDEQVTKQLASNLDQVTVFENPFISQLPKKSIVMLHIDHNFINKLDIEGFKIIFDKVKEKLGNRAKDFSFKLKSRPFQRSEGKKISVSAFNTEFSEKRGFFLYENTDRSVMEETMAKNPEYYNQLAHGYKFPFDDISVDNVLKYCDLVEKNEAEPLVLSQKRLAFQKYSRRVAANDFNKKILKNPFSQIIFYYSKNCGSCKKFLPMYEELALAALKNKENSLIFNRIDNDQNNPKEQDIMVATPKIRIYKSDAKSHPYEYRSNQLNKNMLKQFIDITLSFKIIQDMEKIKSYCNNFSDVVEELKTKRIIKS